MTSPQGFPHLLHFDGELALDLILEMGEGGPSDDGRRQRLLSHSLPRILVGRHQNLPHLLVLLVDLGAGKRKGRGRRRGKEEEEERKKKERKKKGRGGRKREEEEEASKDSRAEENRTEVRR